MHTVFMPSWAALIAATYPPGPEPMTTRSASELSEYHLEKAYWLLTTEDT